MKVLRRPEVLLGHRRREVLPPLRPGRGGRAVRPPAEERELDRRQLFASLPPPRQLPQEVLAASDLRISHLGVLDGHHPVVSDEVWGDDESDWRVGVERRYKWQPLVLPIVLKDHADLSPIQRRESERQFDKRISPLLADCVRARLAPRLFLLRGRFTIRLLGFGA